MILRSVTSLFIYLVFLFISVACSDQTDSYQSLEAGFQSPPDSARPGVYWYFMDGNLSGEGMTKDLESMKEAGIGSVIFLEVNVGIPRGKVDFFSEEWQQLFVHAVRETERLGIEMTLGIGPGWNGSGGPWVNLNESMRNLVSSQTTVSGTNQKQILQLPQPEPQRPFFGIPDEWMKKRAEYYEDVLVVAYPSDSTRLADVEEKALYYRAPISSQAGVKPALPIKRSGNTTQGVGADKVIDLTSKMKPDGTLEWTVPDGTWTILRMGMANVGTITRPAPEPGLGFESDKLSKKALLSHFDNFAGKLLKKTGIPDASNKGGLKMLHIDSWEVGSQNWTDDFIEEFTRSRRYSPVKYLPVYSGQVIDNSEVSERFLFDMRLTVQEMIIKNHISVVKDLAHQNNMRLSVEPYDMSPFADMEVGKMADIPMCEFWSKGRGFNTLYSCFEATSVAHLLGKPVVAAEAFTSDWKRDGFVAHPTELKNQTDWALATGINKLFFHTFTHQALSENLKPGMTMGGYGVHWDRGQTWWPMSSDYHQYITRCSYLLQQGNTVADILYLAPEGAPYVFFPPASALAGDKEIPDRRAYNFDGCPVGIFMEQAEVKDGKIAFPSGASYNVLVLPDSETMTPEMLAKIESLLKKGATVIGNRPVFSPSLTNYPSCDQKLEELSDKVWGKENVNTTMNTREYGKGKLISGKDLYPRTHERDNYPLYEVITDILAEQKIAPDFSSDQEIRYTHRKDGDTDIYFISNRTGEETRPMCQFRATQTPQLWNPVSGERYTISGHKTVNGQTELSIDLAPYQSYFVIFSNNNSKANNELPDISMLTKQSKATEEIHTPWNVSFNKEYGSPAPMVFDKLADWSLSSNDSLKYYSGIATYTNEFTVPSEWIRNETRISINLGKVKNLATIVINGKEAGILWTSPWNLNISDLIKEGTNKLEIKVANLWVNRLIGDEFLPYDGVNNGQWPEWLVNKTPRTSGRYAFSSCDYYTKESPLSESGLLGPVTITAQ